MNCLTETVSDETHWQISADYVALCSEGKDKLGEDLGEWQAALEHTDMRISRTETEYLNVCIYTSKIVCYKPWHWKHCLLKCFECSKHFTNTSSSNK